MSTSKKRKKSSAPRLISLSPDQIRHTLKPHTGFDAYTDEMMSVYEANKEALGDAGIDTAAILDALAKYRALRAAEVAAEKQLALVRETRLNYSSIVWSAELEVYARATRAGKKQPALLKAVAAFAAFLKQRRPRKKATATPAPPVTGG
jgi:hypothetical protein